MKIFKLSQLLFITLLLSSCKLVFDKDKQLNNLEGIPIEDGNPEKKQMEVRFSCDDNDIKKFIDDGWIILKEYTEEKICTWKSVPATKNCDMDRDKGCKITTPDIIGEEKIYLLER